MKTLLRALLICLPLFILGTPSLASEDKAAAPEVQPRVKLITSMGDITVELNAPKAPITVKNFLAYVSSGHYNGTIFHRVIDGFMIQGGGLDADLNKKATHAPIPLESDNGLSNRRGSIAMARTTFPNSATAQFFINVADNTNLDFQGPSNPGYAVFGRVIEGMNVVDKIKAAAVGIQNGRRDVPVRPIVIRSALVLK